jgi:hypothetical protein
MKSTKNRQISRLGKFLFFMLLAVLPTQGRGAMTYEFLRVSDYAAAGGSTVLAPDGSSFTVTVDASGTSGTLFTLSNLLTEGTPVITNIWFDLGTGGLSMTSPTYDTATTSSGVIFQSPVSWTNKEVTELPSFYAEYQFAAEPPPTRKGLNAGESLGILFSARYDDVINAFNQNQLRIGLHVQSVGDGGAYSEWYISQVPLPASVLLGVFAVGLAGRKLRKFI